MTKADAGDYIDKYHIIACGLRNSRLKAKQVAVAELYMALLPLDIIYLSNGPLSDEKGFFCFMVEKSRIEAAKKILHGIGYCNVFHLIVFEETEEKRTWKGRRFSVREFVRQDADLYASQSPHNRVFALAIPGENPTHVVKGYRGDGSLTGRRALPVEDCRCLINLAMPQKIETLLDPFAGAGGIVYAAGFINPAIRTTTIDIDPILSPGLEMYGAMHYVCAAAEARFCEKFDAIVTEVPFAEESDSSVLEGLRNVLGYLKRDGRVSIMSSLRQHEVLHKFICDSGLHVYCSYAVNRKGTDAAIIAATGDLHLEVAYCHGNVPHSGRPGNSSRIRDRVMGYS